MNLFIVNKGSESYNFIDDPYAQMRVPNKVKNMNVELFNLFLEKIKQDF